MSESGGEPHGSAIKDPRPGVAAVGGPKQAARAVWQLAAPALGRSADGEPPTPYGQMHSAHAEHCQAWS